MIASKLSLWYSNQGRILPWKATRDPYFIWLSEVILQQTRVEQGLPYYEKFIKLFPTVFDLAAADEETVMKAWEGLGYYSRARNLHAAAKQVAAVGSFPQTLEGWLDLKGVGPYTARAVVSFAFGLKEAVLDGNVFRVLSRLENDFTPIDSPAARKHFQAIADRHLSLSNDSAVFNQAMMDLGATVCKPANPLCIQCPLNDDCKAFSAGTVARLPVKSKKTKVERLFIDYFYAPDKAGKFPVVQRGEDSFWKKLWELPGRSVSDFEAPPEFGKPFTVIIHKLTHRELNLRLNIVDHSLPDSFLGTSVRYIDFSETDRLTFPKAMWIFFEVLQAPAPKQQELW